MGIQSGLLQDLVVAYNMEVTVHVENGGAVDFVLCIIASKWGLRRTPAIWRRWS